MEEAGSVGWALGAGGTALKLVRMVKEKSLTDFHRWMKHHPTRSSTLGVSQLPRGPSGNVRGVGKHASPVLLLP